MGALMVHIILLILKIIAWNINSVGAYGFIRAGKI